MISDALFSLFLGNRDNRSKEEELEDFLLNTLKEGNFEAIERVMKPATFKYCKSNSLLMGMKVGSVQEK